jgi:hypothetical protein
LTKIPFFGRLLSRIGKKYNQKKTEVRMKQKQNLQPFFARFLENSIEDELDGIRAGQPTQKYPSDIDDNDPPPPGSSTPYYDPKTDEDVIPEEPQ